MNYSTANGTATAGSDYSALTGTITFAAGETTKTITIPVTGDTAVEANETFTVTLASPSGATIADGSATGTIVNNDVAPPPPPPTGGLSLDYDIVSNWGSGFTASMAVGAGSAALNGWTVEFDASFNITSIWNATIVSHVGNHYVVRNADWNGNVAGGKETSFGFQATPGSGGTAASGFTINGTAVGTDPVPVPTLSVADATVAEGNSGAHELAFTVTLSAAATGPVTVAYATSNGTATAGSDYTALSGTLTFAAGETSKVVRVQVSGDTAVEANETLTLDPLVAERRHHRRRHGDRHHHQRRHRHRCRPFPLPMPRSAKATAAPKTSPSPSACRPQRPARSPWPTPPATARRRRAATTRPPAAP